MTDTYTIAVDTPQGYLEPEATFAVDLRYHRAEPDVGLRAGWTCDATLLSWPHGLAQRSRADLVAIIGEDAVAKIEADAAEHFAEAEVGADRDAA